MAAGTYILTVYPHWYSWANSHSVLKQLTMRFTSEVPLQAEMVSASGSYGTMATHVAATAMPNYSKWIYDA